MPQQAWSAKRARQYEHVKQSQRERGADEERAEEIAARVVNKNRAQQGESEQASPTSVHDKSPQQRGGERSGHGRGPGGRTKAQLYNDAKRAGIPGRSSMTKEQLARALREH